MYEAYFGFTKRPFPSTPQVESYFPARTIEAARTTLSRCIERGEGPGMVLGPSGTGKTLLCRVLAKQFTETLQVALLPCGRLGTRRALLQAILYEVGRPYRNMDEGELRLALIDYLNGNQDGPRRILLLIDEAHGLPLRSLEEVRMLTNVVCEGQPGVRLVLSGNSSLEERFANPQLDSFSQRLVGRCYLESLQGGETREYIHAQLDSAGAEGEAVFPAETCKSVYQATNGVPRLINQVCDHSLLLAYVRERKELEPALVEEAWADLQQLPTPWNGESRETAGVIEFGRLEDKPVPAPQSTEEGPTPPALRISPHTTDGKPEPTEPTEQLDQIEHMLAQTEEDFQPAGSIGPELELVFEDPFAEHFAQEEVVSDHDAPRQAAPQPQTAASGPEQGGPVPETPDGVGEQTFEDEASPERPDQETPAMGSEDASFEPPAAAAETSQPAAVAELEPDTVPLHGCPADSAGEPEEPSTIIVEDDYDEGAAVANGPAVAVRRREFGQLFAKLRRG